MELSKVTLQCTIDQQETDIRKKCEEISFLEKDQETLHATNEERCKELQEQISELRLRYTMFSNTMSTIFT